MRLDIYLDLGNIAGYLAIEPVKQLIMDTQVEHRYFPIAGIVPRPISREPSAKSDDPLSHYKHLRWQAKSRFERDELDRDAQRLGIDASHAERQIDAELLHAAFVFVIETFPAETLKFIETCYGYHYPLSKRDSSDIFVSEGEPIEEGLKTIFLECSIDAQEFFRHKAVWMQKFSEHMEQVLETGIHDSPSFILSEETFQGRQNLPLIRWRIGGEVGLPPV